MNWTDLKRNGEKIREAIISRLDELCYCRRKGK